MARKAREKAESGIYYVELRAADGRRLFTERFDFDEFKEILTRAEQEDYSEVYAYYLGDDMIRLVIKEGLTGISEFVRKVTSAYATGINYKYETEGKLFYDRFKSTPLETDPDLVEAVRFVHYGAISKGKGDSIRSSYPCYVKGEGIDAEYVLFLVGGIRKFKELCAIDNPNSFLYPKKGMTDEELSGHIKRLLGRLYAESAQDIDEVAIIQAVMQIEGVTISAVARVLNMSRTAIRKTLKKAEEKDKRKKK